MQAQQSCECGICAVSGFERNAYYYSKSMTVRDMVAEQNYFIEKRRLINRSVIGWGVVCGLDVSAHNGRIHVSDGFGIDAGGRELLVCDFEGVDPLTLIEDCHTGRMTECGEEWVLCLEYEECRAEMVRLPPSGCCTDSDWEHNRIRETVRLSLKTRTSSSCPGNTGATVRSRTSTRAKTSLAGLFRVRTILRSTKLRRRTRCLPEWQYRRSIRNGQRNLG